MILWKLILLLFLSVVKLVEVASFGVPGSYPPKIDCSSSVERTKEVSTTRRGFGHQIVAQITLGSILATTVFPQISQAKSTDSSSELDDIGKLKKGYERLSYLVENWEPLTTVCGRTDNPYQGKNGCERSPMVVMDYMGFKSMNDPLFKADKVLKRLSSQVPSDSSVDYLDAMEKYGEAAEEASGMAYVSSWGEANPGGGKDQVERWIERSKINVVDARDSLGTALRILGEL